MYVSDLRGRGERPTNTLKDSRWVLKGCVGAPPPRGSSPRPAGPTQMVNSSSLPPAPCVGVYLF